MKLTQLFRALIVAAILGTSLSAHVRPQTYCALGAAGAVATTAAAGYDWYSNPQAHPNLVRHIAAQWKKLATTRPDIFVRNPNNRLMAATAYGTVAALAALGVRDYRSRGQQLPPLPPAGTDVARGTGEQPLPGAVAAVAHPLAAGTINAEGTVPHPAAGVGPLTGVVAGTGIALTAAIDAGTHGEALAPTGRPQTAPVVQATPPPTPAELLAQFNAQLRAPAGADFTALATALARIERHIGNHEPTAVQKALEAAVAQAHPMAIKALLDAGKDPALRALWVDREYLWAAVPAAFKSPDPEACLRALVAAGYDLNNSEDYHPSAAVELMKNAHNYPRPDVILQALFDLAAEGHVDLSRARANGKTPLQEAVMRLGMEESAQKFANDKAQFLVHAINLLTYTTGKDDTLMHIAVQSRGGRLTVQYLVNLGLPYNRRSLIHSRHLTPLQQCCPQNMSHYQALTAQTLIRQGALTTLPKDEQEAIKATIKNALEQRVSAEIAEQFVNDAVAAGEAQAAAGRVEAIVDLTPPIAAPVVPAGAGAGR